LNINRSFIRYQRLVTMKKRTQLVLAVCLVMSLNLLGQPLDCNTLEDDIPTSFSELHHYLSKKQEIGQSFLFNYIDPELNFFGSYGCAIKKEQAFSSKSIFDIGSVTKTFTATAILQLAESGKLSVLDKISQYFPDVPEDKKEITIHQLLIHTSGLSTYHDSKGDFEQLNVEEAVERIFGSAIISNPGVQFHYSNSGFPCLLGSWKLPQVNHINCT
jgi:hypothetical protein